MGEEKMNAEEEEKERIALEAEGNMEQEETQRVLQRLELEATTETEKEENQRPELEAQEAEERQCVLDEGSWRPEPAAKKNLRRKKKFLKRVKKAFSCKG